jgi:NAD(P)H-dependent flavin oxidoreductase YrpB (nitropropane dioxygenase family)
MIGTAGIPTDTLAEMLETLGAAADGPFGANFLMPFLDPEAVSIAAERCRVVEFFYGEPDRSLVETVHSKGALASWQVGSHEEARAAVDAGCDLVVLQGIEAGGHVRGVRWLASLLEETTDLTIPIVAAGGIGSAQALARALDSPASAGRVGTRFVAAIESRAHPLYVDALIRASAADTVLTEEFAVGWPNAPARVLRASLEAARSASAEHPAVTVGEEERPVPRYAVLSPIKDARGNVAAMPHYAGFSVDSVKKRQPAAEIVAELCSRI